MTSRRVARVALVLLGGGLACLGGCASCDNPNKDQPDASADASIADVAIPETAKPEVESGPGTLCPTPPHGTSALHGRVFGATSLAAFGASVYELTGFDGGQAGAPFANVPADGWLGPMLATTDGKLYVATRSQSGSIWEISAGGDFAAKSPVAAGVFGGGSVSDIAGIARDADGNFYLSSSDNGPTQIAKVALGKDGGTSTLLPTPRDNPTGLVVCNGALFVSEGNKGRVVRHDLASGVETDFATGFVAGAGHVSGMMVVDQRGHLLVNWKATGGDAGGVQGIFDITAGGDFSNATPRVVCDFYTDVNPIAVNEANDLFVAGASTGALYVARAAGEGWSPFVVFAQGLMDTESVGVGP